jgi:tetratricopeptide (TPR) repeat protein
MRRAKNQNNFNVRPEVLFCLFLVLSTLLVYFQVGTFEFDNYDTAKYVYNNNQVKAGLTAKGIKWAFTTFYFSNWHPLTWLSHMLDVQLYGLDPGRHHLTNVLFHIANTLLLFGVLRRMTGKLWQSGFVAALFALHPLHVESVVWVAERKDLLSTIFGLLVLWSYTRYVQNPGVGRYVAVMLFFILGLMTKPMMVTLPFVLLLLDYWPLRRLHFESANKVEQPAKQGSTRWFLVVEKLPLFIVSAASCIVTIYAQKSGDSIVPLDAYPLLFRISNAFISYVSYVGKMIWPSNLAIIYPYNIILPTLNILAAILIVLGISLLAVRFFKSRPWFIVGWFWYLGTLIPVIGLVQVGTQSMADRYTYIPLIGLFIILAWALFEFLARWSYQKLRFAVITLGVAGVLMAIAWQQVGYWKNSVTIFKRAVDVTDKNFVAHNNLGHGLLMQGKTTEAFEHFKKSSEINPKFAIAHLNLGLALSEQKKYAEAIQSFTKAVEEKPNFAIAYNLIGKTQSQIGKSDQAIQNYLKAININPKYVEAYNSAGVALIRMGKPRRAIAFFREALRLDPDYYAAQRNLDKTLAALKMVNDKAVVN